MTALPSPTLTPHIAPNAIVLASLAFQRFKTWMLEIALPFWSSTGLSPDGGVVECLSLDGRPAKPGFKRVRVHARQIYVFSHAHVLGVPAMLPAARQGVDFLLRHGRDDAGGWVVKMGEAGGVVDNDLDLYDQAFVILALAWWHKASGEYEALALARDTLSMIDTRFTRKNGQGFLCRQPDRGEQLQNPHMHLLESVLALHGVMPTAQTDQVVRKLLQLFETHLFDPETGTVGEYFDRNWQSPADATGDRLEPGHHYEWVWLLHRARQIGFAVDPTQSDRLFAFAETYGLAPGSALIHDEVAPDGRILTSSHRSWPQTERIKALIARGEASGRWPMLDIFQALDALWTHYIASAPAGGWVDHITADAKSCVSAVPASTLYHLFLAYAELDRTAYALFNTAQGDAA